jgi:hypothetical protein
LQILPTQSSGGKYLKRFCFDKLAKIKFIAWTNFILRSTKIKWLVFTFFATVETIVDLLCGLIF